MDPRTWAAYEADAATWLASRGKGSALTDGRLDAFAERLTPCARVLDVGCGPGWYAAELEGWGARAVGVDLTRAMLEEMGRRYPDLPRVQADIAHLPFADHAFDGAFADACYQHLPLAELPGALADLHRVLRPGAPVALLLPSLAAADPDAFDAGVQQSESRSDRKPPLDRLFSAFTPDRATSLLADAGFHDIDISLTPKLYWMNLEAQA